MESNSLHLNSPNFNADLYFKKLLKVSHFVIDSV